MVQSQTALTQTPELLKQADDERLFGAQSGGNWGTGDGEAWNPICQLCSADIVYTDGGEEANTNGNGDAMVQCCYCNLVYCETCLTDKKPSTVPPTRSETNLAMMKASITGDANWACPCCWDLAATQLAKGARRNQKR